MLSLISLLALTTFTQAAEVPCANMAKYAAIRAYKAEVGEIQGSDGIQYSAVAIHTRGNRITYLVTISDNNEDGETWEVDYKVGLFWQKDAKPECKILFTNKAATR